ncbi:DUF3429 domain-containing protein [Roseomonas sp. CCTCC AB2023176]|uniref:DUF3429 domain-containing protein n=1 Tax=Roseomonas sp. CCTCC AB2023176 TaxID=3342640 RepID=UPI0035D6B1AA
MPDSPRRPSPAPSGARPDDTLPAPARILGPAGLIPFAALCVAALVWPEWRFAALVLLVTYGALIASFLGGVHWGLALRPRPGEEWAAWPRLALGVLPSLIAWAALFLLPRAGSLVAIAALLLATAGIETLATRRGLMPPAYLRLRWFLSGGAAGFLLLAATVA